MEFYSKWFTSPNNNYKINFPGIDYNQNRVIEAFFNINTRNDCLSKIQLPICLVEEGTPFILHVSPGMITGEPCWFINLKKLANALLRESDTNDKLSFLKSFFHYGLAIEKLILEDRLSYDPTDDTLLWDWEDYSLAFLKDKDLMECPWEQIALTTQAQFLYDEYGLETIVSFDGYLSMFLEQMKSFIETV